MPASAGTGPRQSSRIVFPVNDHLMREHLDSEWRERLKKSGLELEVPASIPKTAEQWCELLKGAVALILGCPLPSGVLADCDGIEVVSFAGTGVGDRVDLAEAAENGITVTNVMGYGDNAVAEHTIGLLLSLMRHIPQHDRLLRQGRWESGAQGWELRGRRLGVVGLGGNGARVAGLARGLGMEVVAWTRRATPERAARHQVQAVPLAELFKTSDAVTLHIALTPATEGFIGADLLGLMRPGALLVNTSRGRVLDQDALVRALTDGSLGGAALDVFEEEPLPAGHPLTKLSDRTVLTPHVAYNTVAATVALVDGAVENVLRYLDGEARNVIIGPQKSSPWAGTAQEPDQAWTSEERP